MHKSRLLEAAKRVAAQLEVQPYDHWVKEQFPIVYEDVLDGEEVQIEIKILSKKRDYVQLGVCVSHPATTYKRLFGLTINVPVCYSTVIYR